MVAVSTSEVALLRLVAQRLAGPPEPDATAVVRHLLALQGQDLRGALVSTALRTPSADLAGVRAALDAGSVVRSWPMRGTLHLVPAEDLGWLLSLTTERVLRGAATRRAALGVDEPLVERARDLLVTALRGGGRLSREQALQVLADDGLLSLPQRGYHLLWTLAQTGSTCWGPLLGDEDVAAGPGTGPGTGGGRTEGGRTEGGRTEGGRTEGGRTEGAGAGGRAGEQALVLLDEWVPAPRRLGREEALGELALRYLRSHGPATVADLVRWCGLTVRDVRAGVALARPHLEAVEVEGAPHLMDPLTPERLAEHRADARRTVLLPGFDEMVLGYADRSATVPAEHAGRVVPGGNGMFLGTVVTDGRAVGTWRRTGRRTGPAVEAVPFGRDLPSGVQDDVVRLGASLPG